MSKAIYKWDHSDPLPYGVGDCIPLYMLPGDLRLVNDSQDVAQVKEDIGHPTTDYDAFFVAQDDQGNYLEVWGFFGTVPNLGKDCYKLI